MTPTNSINTLFRQGDPIELSITLTGKVGQPNGDLLKFIRTNPYVSESNLIWDAVRAFWLVKALREASHYTQSELIGYKTKCLRRLIKQEILMSAESGVEEKLLEQVIQKERDKVNKRASESIITLTFKDDKKDERHLIGFFKKNNLLWGKGRQLIALSIRAFWLPLACESSDQYTPEELNYLARASYFELKNQMNLIKEKFNIKDN
ncbi:hypothetical protein [Gloeothece verrucosa]|uniref:Uncharacterized protein n=1 Tax=Gloeothece verrucosa (strain PCC 7822) TaxID=497965 RepID=E0UNR2_GLOV7|nr:hypothetical protein [Gloeothece verrucosa]ADN18592.1 hypothetical protein Cyan7822_6954 [Gloeothece verrucosa PCC 7822]